MPVTPDPVTNDTTDAAEQGLWNQYGGANQRTQADLAALNAKYQGLGQSFGQMEGDYGNLKNLYTQAQQQIQGMNLAPTMGDRLQAAGSDMSAMGAVTRSGALPAVSSSQAMNQQAREMGLMKMQLMQKYGIDAAQAEMMAHQMGMQMSQAGLQQLTSRYNADQRMQESSLQALSNLGMKQALGQIGAANKPIVIQNGQATPNTGLEGYNASNAFNVQRAKQQAMMGTVTPDTMNYLVGAFSKEGMQAIPYGLWRSNPMLATSIVSEGMKEAQGQGIDPGTLVNQQQFYKIQQKLAGDFANPNSTTMQSIKAQNTAFNHLDTLVSELPKLDPTNNESINRIGQALQREFGLNTAPTTVSAIRGVVLNEVTKAVVARGGTLTDREDLQHTMSQNLSLPQMMDQIHAQQKLLGGRMGSEKVWYNSSGMPAITNRPFESWLSGRMGEHPEVLDALSGDMSTPLSAVPSGQVAGQGPQPHIQGPATGGGLSPEVMAQAQDIKALVQAHKMSPADAVTKLRALGFD